MNSNTEPWDRPRWKTWGLCQRSTSRRLFFSVKFNVQLIHHGCVYSCLPSPGTGFAEINRTWFVVRTREEQISFFLLLLHFGALKRSSPKFFLRRRTSVAMSNGLGTRASRLRRRAPSQMKLTWLISDAPRTCLQMLAVKTKPVHGQKREVWKEDGAVGNVCSSVSEISLAARASSFWPTL